MKAVLPMLPKLNFPWPDKEPAPILWTRDGSALELFPELLNLLF